MKQAQHTLSHVRLLMPRASSITVDTFLTHPLLYTRVSLGNAEFIWAPMPRVATAIQAPPQAEPSQQRSPGSGRSGGWRQTLNDSSAVSPSKVNYFPRLSPARADSDLAAFDTDRFSESHVVDGFDWNTIAERLDGWCLVREIRLLSTSIGIRDATSGCLQVIDVLLENNSTDIVACIMPSVRKQKPTEVMYDYMSTLVDTCAEEYFFHPRCWILNVPTAVNEIVTCWKCPDLVKDDNS